MPRSLPAAPESAHLRLSSAREPYRPRPWHLWAWSVAAGGAAVALNALGAAWIVVPASFLAVLGYQTKHARLLRDYLSAALLHLDDGDYDAAERVFDAMAKHARPRLKVLGVLGVATVNLRRGDVARALPLYAEILRHGDKAGRRIYDMCTEYLAMCYALGEELDAADWWLDAGRTLTPITPLASAVVGARQEQYDQVVAFGVPRFGGDGRRVFAHEIRAFHLLRAFSVSRATFDASVPAERIAREIDEQVALARPAFAEEYDYLTRTWPELEQFITEHRWDRIGVADDAELPRAVMLGPRREA